MKQKNAGFSLIETLVALTILALATGTLLGIFSAAARNTSVAMQTQKALAVAENQIALVDGIGKYRFGIAEGMYGDQYHWTVEISELVTNDAIVRLAQPVLLTVNIDWQDGWSAITAVSPCRSLRRVRNVGMMSLWFPVVRGLNGWLKRCPYFSPTPVLR